MNIVITQVGSALHEGGISAFIFELSSALIRDGHAVHLISGREVPKTQKFVRELFDVERFPRIVALQKSQTQIWSLGLDRDTMRELLLWFAHGSNLIKKISPDMIISNGVVPLCSSAFKVAVCHDLELGTRVGSYSLHLLYDKLLYKMYDNVVTTSTELAELVSEKLKIKRAKTIIIPTCIDTHRYTVLSQEQREHAILHVGTWGDKNLETTLKAFYKLATNDHTIKLYIVGNLWEKHKRTLSKFKEEIYKRISCVGRISKVELRNLYSKVKVTSVPSIYRVPVLSPTVLESFASGTPVVGGSTAISRDLLVDGYNGFRVCPTDSDRLSERLSLLTKNNELWNSLSTNALSVARIFDSSAVARKYVRLFNSKKTP